MLDVAAGMNHLSKENIVHRDLAARNVLLTESFVAKVSDFGLSRLAEDESGIYSSRDIGPLKWMAKESLQERQYNQKVFIYSNSYPLD